MPELTFVVHWPDGTQMSCYSPSTTMRRHLASGSYRLDEFLLRARQGLADASERVRLLHGHPCSRAATQFAEIEKASTRFAEIADPHVTVDPY